MLWLETQQQRSSRLKEIRSDKKTTQASNSSSLGAYISTCEAFYIINVQLSGLGPPDLTSSSLSLRPGFPFPRRGGGRNTPPPIRRSFRREGWSGDMRCRHGWCHARGSGRVGQVPGCGRAHERGVRSSHVGPGAPTYHAERVRPWRVGREHRQRLRSCGVCGEVA